MEKLPNEIRYEILHQVFGSGSGNEKLILVNREWFDYGICYFWSSVEANRLLRVPQHRRQIYAEVVDELTVEPYEEEVNQQLADLEFISLDTLTINYPERPKGGQCLADISTLHQYMPQSLLSVTIRNVVDSRILRYLQENCQDLKTIILIHESPEIEQEALDGLFWSVQTLQNVHLYFNFYGVDPIPFPPSTLEALARLGQLSWLTLGKDIGRDVIEEANFAAIPPPFPVLIGLRMKTYPSTIPLLARIFRNVSQVDFDLCGIIDPEDDPEDPETGGNALRYLSVMAGLQSLKITSLGWWSCTADELLSLKTLKHLQILSLRCGEMAPIQVLGLTDAHFRDLFGSLGQLRSLTLPITCWGMTAASLAALGQCCPFLEECSLDGESINMHHLEPYSGPLFPALKSLLLKKLVIEEPGVHPQTGEPLTTSSDPRDHARQIAIHFPMLNSFWCDILDREPDRPGFDFNSRVRSHYKVFQREGLS